MLLAFTIIGSLPNVTNNLINTVFLIVAIFIYSFYLIFNNAILKNQNSKDNLTDLYYTYTIIIYIFIFVIMMIKDTYGFAFLNFLNLGHTFVFFISRSFIIWFFLR